MPGKSVSVLYLMGQDRSGSTILGAVLGSLEGYVHVGEVRHLWTDGFLRAGRCGCGRPVPECELWPGVAREALALRSADPERVSAWGREILRLRHLGRILQSTPGRSSWEAFEAYADVSGALYRALARHTGARVIVDSSKQPVHAALVSRLPGIDSRFVHLVRDPRAVAHSWKRGKLDPGRGPDGRMWRRPPTAAARAWVLANGAAARVRRHLPADRSLVLRYEHLTEDPRASLREVLGLMGEESRSLPLIGARTAEVRPGHPVAGNPARFRIGPVELREDDEWLVRQPPRDRLLVTAMTLPFLRRYGYPVRARRPRPRGGGRRAGRTPDETKSSR